MTREEAIKRIERHIEHHRIYDYPHLMIGEALDMAIAALREQDVADANVGKSNADHIRSMTDEELAKFIVDSQFNVLSRGLDIMGLSCQVTREDIYGDIPEQLEWLKQPYKEDT